MTSKAHGAGHSSFALIDAAVLLAEFESMKDGVVLDLGCGPGHYSIALAEALGSEATIHALDLWDEGIALLRQAAASRSLGNIHARVADLAQPLDLADGSIDACLMATVLHELIKEDRHGFVLAQVRRVLKPGGTLAVIEFEKTAALPGPPPAVRIAFDELTALLARYGFSSHRRLNFSSALYFGLFS